MCVEARLVVVSAELAELVVKLYALCRWYGASGRLGGEFMHARVCKRISQEFV